MPFECDEVPVSLDLSGGYLTLAPIGYRGKDERFEIEAGFWTDLATRPGWLGGLVAKDGLVALAAILHDWLLQRRRYRFERGLPQPISSVDIDGLFRRCLREAVWTDEHGRQRRVGRILRGVYWLGVRWAALFSPYRREGWWRTAHVVIPWSLLLLPILAPYALLSLLIIGGGRVLDRGLRLLWPDPLPTDEPDTCQPVVDLTPRRNP